MPLIARKWKYPDLFEIERIRHLPDGSRQYQMRQRSRWVEWDARIGPGVRQPDWQAKGGDS